ncbi:unnamed protein product [Rotaria sp. Silwood1]|nr:unnamed protein product [Rotaria sp. Silwood1]CAF1259955.1 unnamed protein product [Rotaria sp. Silwood1]CAF1264761.1 unnamed protein product [Rotaria sp. Silwood1]CAF3490463.1 unnamed protein product [Rotaria sp. Silwood1]CAF3509887.1 unnamed protein product [Rotaria sp. Silwood1]
MTDSDYNIVRQYLTKAMQPKLNWYRSTIANVDWEDERNIDPTIRRSILFMRGKQIDICRETSLAKQNSFTPDIEIIDFDTGHWLMEEQPEAINQAIEEWIKKIL